MDWIQFVLIRSWKLFSVCTLIHPPVPLSRVCPAAWQLRALTRSTETKWAVKSSVFEGRGAGSLYHFGSALAGEYLFYSPLFMTTCSSFPSVLLFVAHWRTSSLTIIRLSPPCYSWSEMICNHMVKINFLKTAFQT